MAFSKCPFGEGVFPPLNIFSISHSAHPHFNLHDAGFGHAFFFWRAICFSRVVLALAAPGAHAPRPTRAVTLEVTRLFRTRRDAVEGAPITPDQHSVRGAKAAGVRGGWLSCSGLC